jgi:hypothetical protein
MSIPMHHIPLSFIDWVSWEKKDPVGARQFKETYAHMHMHMDMQHAAAAAESGSSAASLTREDSNRAIRPRFILTPHTTTANESLKHARCHLSLCLPVCLTD